MNPSSALAIIQPMTRTRHVTLPDRDLTDLRRLQEAYLRALAGADGPRAARDEAIREALNAPGARPSQRAIARELGLSAARVAQIAKGTR
jgi:hypothetical protein